MDVPEVQAASVPTQEAASRIRNNPLVHWLIGDGWNLPDPSDITGEMARAMRGMGISVSRLRITLRTLHPQFLGTTYTWTLADDAVEEYLPAHELLQDEKYLNSPYAPIFAGAGGVRRRLEVDESTFDYSILHDLKADGATDYVAMPLVFSDGKMNAITIAVDRPGGFSTRELEMIDDALPILARVLETHALRRTANVILDTYLGRQSGARVMDGLIRRGDGERIHAVIWFSDLRGSTALADRLPPDTFLALLDDYFEATAGAVLGHGGEVLRFIGDAALSIFPVGTVTPHPERCHKHVDACQRALQAARDAIAAVAERNAARAEADLPLIRYGIGLHLGTVIYGNIGTRDRLEFSVIGAAANEAARLENMCKRLGYPLIISEAFADVIKDDLVALGSHAFRGVSEPQELYTLPELTDYTESR